MINYNASVFIVDLSKYYLISLSIMTEKSEIDDSHKILCHQIT